LSTACAQRSPVKGMPLHPRNRGSGGQRVGSRAAAVIEACTGFCWRRLTLRVQADAGTRRGKRATRARDGRDVITRAQRHHRALTAVTALAVRYCAARHSAAPLRTAASAAPAASGRPWPSALSIALRSNTLGSCLANACAGCARARSWPAGAQRVRCDCTPCAPAAASIRCCPRPRIARQGLAPHHVRHARSRGFGPSVDITRDYAQASCLCGAACRVLRHASPRPRNPSLCHGPPARPCARQGAALPARRCSSILHALRASARHPWLARFGSLAAIARGLLGTAPARLSPRAGNAKSGHQEAVNSQSPPRGGCRKLLAVVVSA